MDRRDFLKSAGGALAGSCAASSVPLFGAAPPGVQHVSLEIAPVHVELASGIVIPTVGYNGQVPGPILRLREGMPVQVDVTNRTDREELVHWHGLGIGSIPDGASEEGSPLMKPHGSLRYTLAPKPAGTRWYHTHTMAKNDLSRATYTGQYGFLIVEPKSHPGDYDLEVFLAIHHWEPSFMAMEDRYENCPLVQYKYASFNDKLLGAGEPLRVREGQRVLFHLLNASATEDVFSALPGHQFDVVALDGNPVPQRAKVNVLSISVAERIDAIVEMNAPGKWIFGSPNDKERQKGLGIVVEYAGSVGDSVWRHPGIADWSYALFTAPAKAGFQPDEVFTMLFEKKRPGYPPSVTGSRFSAESMRKEEMERTGDDRKIDEWTINGRSYADLDTLKVCEGRRYRFRFVNNSGCAHPVHLHRHSYELVAVEQVPIFGIMKDTVNLRRYNVIEADFIADNPGPTLFHCHQQLHMDYGFMQLIEYV